jgi:cytochrome c oxidase subunit 4
MSNTELEAKVHRAGVSARAGVAAQPHKKPNYWVVFIVLGVITAMITLVEMYIDYIPLPQNVIHTSFVIMSLIKATLVAMYYMHLKFDSFVYTLLFMMPVLFAVFLMGVLAVGYLI